MSSVALYEIGDMRDVLSSWLVETDGELTPELEALLAELDAQAEDKIERVALFIREQKAEAEKIRIEEVRLTARRKAAEKGAASLTDYLHREMHRLGKTKVVGVLATVAIQQNPPRVVGELNEDDLRFYYGTLHAGFVRHVPETFALDRTAILDLHKAGEPLPAGLSVERGTSVRIR